MIRDLFDRLKLVRAISPVSESGTTAHTSQLIDTAGFDSLLFAIDIAAAGTSTATYAVTMTEGAKSDGSDQAAVSSSQILGTLAAAGWSGSGGTSDGTNGRRKVGYMGTKRYVQLTVTPTGNSAACVFSVQAILGNSRSLPLSTQAT